MKKQRKSILVLTMISFFTFTMMFLLCVDVFSDDESYTPPPPDKNMTLPANDGEPDGCNSSRFKCVMGGEAVLDNQTGLSWSRNADIVNKALSWQEAKEFCKNSEIGNRKGWRLPTREEMITILDTSQSNPALPDGNPFKNVPQQGSESTWGTYWTSTEYEGDSNRALIINVGLGRVSNSLKFFDYLIWPVLGGN